LNISGPLEIVLLTTTIAMALTVSHQVFVLPEHVPPHNPTWHDPTQKSAIVMTFDEDFNNLSTGIGNEGNHIPDIHMPHIGQEGDNVHMPPR
jgi:hypothetical protein